MSSKKTKESGANAASQDNRIAKFETALKELETLVERMEKGGADLEDSLKQFERGVELARTCQQALKDAELKIQVLMEKDGEQTIADFAEEADSE